MDESGCTDDVAHHQSVCMYVMEAATCYTYSYTDIQAMNISRMDEIGSIPRHSADKFFCASSSMSHILHSVYKQNFLELMCEHL